MRYDALMFVALVLALAASGVHALLPPQQPIVLEPQPVSERVALLERDYEYLNHALEELQEEMRRQMGEIKQMLREQDDETMKWIFIVIGLLITGDRGWALLQRVKNNKKEGKP